MYAAIGFGMHTWLWFGSAVLLLVHAGGCWWNGLLYLIMSELCLHGFAFHPYLGYFLGVSIH